MQHNAVCYCIGIYCFSPEVGFFVVINDATGGRENARDYADTHCVHWTAQTPGFDLKCMQCFTPRITPFLVPWYSPRPLSHLPCKGRRFPAMACGGRNRSVHSYFFVFSFVHFSVFSHLGEVVNNRKSKKGSLIRPYSYEGIKRVLL